MSSKLKSTITWIDASQELPDDEMTVLIALSDGEVWIGFHLNNEWHLVLAEPVDQVDGTTVTWRYEYQADGTTVLWWAEFPTPPAV